MATTKQVTFIQNLMAKREIGDLYDSVEAQSVRRGFGEELSTRQASNFINMLLECPEVKATRNIGDTVNHPKFGEGTIIAVESDRYRIQFGSEVKTVLASFV